MWIKQVLTTELQVVFEIEITNLTNNNTWKSKNIRKAITGQCVLTIKDRDAFSKKYKSKRWIKILNNLKLLSYEFTKVKLLSNVWKYT